MPTLTKPASCLGCPLYGDGTGWTLPVESGSRGIALVGEASGEAEVAAGQVFVGRAGFLLNDLLTRATLRRESLTIANCLACRPPHNELRGRPYEAEALARCAGHLDRVLDRAQPKVIVTLGETATRRVLGLGLESPLAITSWRGYPVRSTRYQAWVIPTVHPAFVLRGQLPWAQAIWYDLEAARQIAVQGVVPYQVTPLCDPPLREAEAWATRHATTSMLAVDVETLHPQEAEDEETTPDLETSPLLRIGFAADAGPALSVPWHEAYFPVIRRLLSLPAITVMWNARFDRRCLAHAGFPVAEPVYDAMLAWHIAEPRLRKKLECAAPCLLPGQLRWKHLSVESPAFYNATDASVTWRAMQVLEGMLKETGRWPLFLDRTQVERILHRASTIGVLLDQDRRAELSGHLSQRMQTLLGQLQHAVPTEVRTLHPPKGYVRTPKDTTEMVQLVLDLPIKGTDILRGKVELVHSAPPPPIVEDQTYVVPVRRWATLKPFVPSQPQLARYAAWKHHRVLHAGRKVETTSFDDLALAALVRRYPLDPVYPLVLQYRAVQTELTRYVGEPTLDGGWQGGMPLGTDGRVHTTFKHDPWTLRLSSEQPNLQNLPRGDGQDMPLGVRHLLVASPGHVLWEADYRAIEAILLGYCAKDPAYLRLAQLGIHAYVVTHLVGRPVNLQQEDILLRGHLLTAKRAHPTLYEAAKRMVHATNYGMSVEGLLKRYPDLFPTRLDAVRMRNAYLKAAPGLLPWQRRTTLQVEKDGYLDIPLGPRVPFWKMFEYAYNPMTKGWERQPGEEYKPAISGGPQGAAAGVISCALLEIGQDLDLWATLRLQVHDALVFEFPEDQVEALAGRAIGIMERPIPSLPLPPAWNMGPCLAFDVEAKIGRTWGDMSPWFPGQACPT